MFPGLTADVVQQTECAHSAECFALRVNCLNTLLLYLDQTFYSCTWMFDPFSSTCLKNSRLHFPPRLGARSKKSARLPNVCLSFVLTAEVFSSCACVETVSRRSDGFVDCFDTCDLVSLGIVVPCFPAPTFVTAAFKDDLSASHCSSVGTVVSVAPWCISFTSCTCSSCDLFNRFFRSTWPAI